MSLATMFADDTPASSGETGSPAWLPDETWPLSYEHTQRRHHDGRFTGWYPPSAA